MSDGSNHAFDCAALLEQQERDALIAVASVSVRAHGADACVECGCVIPKARRIAAPFALRCIECQEAIEREARR